MTATDQVYVATQSGCCEIKGELFVFVKGVTRVRGGHGLLKACPDYFEAADEHVHHEIEQATKAPGEKRGKA
jgi:hypothetical protein